MLRQLRSALVAFLSLALLTGVVYPLLVTLVAKVAFAREANGSLIEKDGKVVGSALLGQPFDDPKYFWGRPSATSPFPYNAGASSGSNLGPTNPQLTANAKARIDALRAADPGNDAPVPVDLVTASGSGLDPDISPAAAEFQADRVARARGLAPARVRETIAKYTQFPTFGVLGEARVNVVTLNSALDDLH